MMGKCVATNNRLAPLAPVILCLVHRIFWQQGSDLVNKLALLLHKCFDRMLSTFCKFFKYPSPEACASPSPSRGEGSGLLRRYTPRNDAERNNIAFKGLDVVRQYAALLERRVQQGTRARKALVVTRQANPLGRSMIEMLGVLAIIAVLSVGGIAGYSKAMEKYKVNKALEEYSFLIYGLLEHMRDIQNLTQENSSKAIGLVTWVKAANLIPQTWTSEVKGTIVDASLQDPYGNDINLYSRAGLLVMDMYLGGYSQNDNGGYFSATFPSKLCSELYRNLAQPLHSALTSVTLTGGIVRYGDAVCDGKTKKCVRDITLAEIDSACKYCKGTFACGLILQF